MESIEVTIEQIRLINKLRQTGLSKDQIWLIIHDLERKEKEVESSKSSSIPVYGESVGSSAVTRGNEASVPNNPLIPREISTSIMDDLDDFNIKGEQEQISEIRQFIKTNKIRQNKIAEIIDTSPSFISRFLNRDPKAQSMNLKNKLFYWYILYKNHPEIIESFKQNPVHYQTGRTSEPDPKQTPIKRFQFTKLQLEVLENFYKLTINPDEYTMNDILVRLNSNYMGIKKVGKVTTTDVENWFQIKKKNTPLIKQEHI